MPNTSRPAITDREAWPDQSLRNLLERIDDELQRRRSSGAEQDEDLTALEQRLLNEAKRYQRSGGVIRG